MKLLRHKCVTKKNEWNAYNGLDTKLWADGAVKPDIVGHGHAQQSRDFINELNKWKDKLDTEGGNI